MWWGKKVKKNRNWCCDSGSHVSLGFDLFWLLHWYRSVSTVISLLFNFFLLVEMEFATQRYFSFRISPLAYSFLLSIFFLLNNLIPPTRIFLKGSQSPPPGCWTADLASGNSVDPGGGWRSASRAS